MKNINITLSEPTIIELLKLHAACLELMQERKEINTIVYKASYDACEQFWKETENKVTLT